MKYLIVVFSFFLISCGETKGSIDPELWPFVYDIQQKVQKYTGNIYNFQNISFELGHIDSNHDGHYYLELNIINSSAKIIIDRDFFERNRTNKFIIQALILHEIGHYYNLQHSVEFDFIDGEYIPKTLMYSSASMVGQFYLERHEAYYYNELFQDWFL